MKDCNCKYSCENQIGSICRVQETEFVDGNKREVKVERLNDSIPDGVVLKRMGGYLKGLEQTIENNQQLIDYQKEQIYKMTKINEGLIGAVKKIWGVNAYNRLRNIQKKLQNNANQHKHIGL